MNAQPATLSFRPATEQDIPTIQRLARQIWRQHYPSIISIEQIEYMLEWMYSTEKIRSDLADPQARYDLLLFDEKPVGYASYRLEPPSAFLSKLYLDPELHGRGFGRRALERIEAFAKENGASSIYLFVNKRNEKAIRAYLRFGFEMEEAVVNPIGNGFVMDDFKMRKRFANV
ncbi:MAG: GNAT family N-acetyltransferase [Chloroherpetonaceae bacterium]|nr:GNAT family N-acetyltransferase [Chloroherpetonaceae bacterium]MDW8437672.1 GNAT family N-acetyltransferase [Chloroherpetonaceae bacterium]